MTPSEMKKRVDAANALFDDDFWQCYKKCGDKSIHTNAISGILPFFYPDDCNYLHNYKFRELVLMKISRNDEINKMSLVKNSGVDMDLHSKVECKSVTTKDETRIIIKPTLVIGQIDKIQNKANNRHPLYASNSDVDLVCGIFRSSSADPIIVFKVSAAEWAPTIQHKITQAHSNRVGADGVVDKRDSVNDRGTKDSAACRAMVNIEVGDFVNAKSFSIIYISIGADKIKFKNIDTNSSLVQSLSKFK